MSAWWQPAVTYEIYPRSFQDSADDGIGDLAGIERRLPYLQWLGVDALWLGPIYRSPLADYGYDVSDHTAIAPELGSEADFDRLLASAHARGLRVILDLVASHTSIEHPWFRGIEWRPIRFSPVFPSASTTSSSGSRVLTSPACPRRRAESLLRAARRRAFEKSLSAS